MGNPTNHNVSIVAGPDANIAGIVHGDVNYYSFYGSPGGGTSRIELDSYRTRVCNKFDQLRSTYTLLDVSPVVSTIDSELKRVENTERTLKDAVANSRRLVLFGGAGAGKTTSLRFLAYSITSDPASFSVSEKRLPDACLLIDLTRFRPHPFLTPLHSILVLIGEVLHAPSEAEPPSLIAIHDLLSSQSRLILLFDGLNEVPPEGRSSCLEGLVNLADKYPSHSYVLATRPHGFRSVEGWEIAALRELREPQIRDFLSRYTDPETGPALTKSLRGNPLATTPLFLSYILKIFRSGTVGTSSWSSRSAVVGSYVEILLKRDRPDNRRSGYFQETDVLKSALITLAERSNSVGQSMAFRDAVEVLAKHERVDFQTATNVLEELFARTLLVRDGHYVRFWHQTIQEHFHAANIVRVWRDNSKGTFRSKRSIKRVFVAADEQSALLLLPYFLNNEELRIVVKRCVKWNIGLAVSWLQDMHYEDDRRGLTSEAVRDLRHRALLAGRYSRLGRRKWQRMLWALFITYITSPVLALSAVLMTWISDTSVMLISGEVSILLFWLYLIIHAVLSPGPGVLDQLFYATFDVRNHDLRAALVSIADEVERSKLTAFSQKSLAKSVSRTGVEDGAFMILRNSPSLLAGISALGRVADEGAVSILEFCLSCKNINSLKAMESLRQRAALFPREADQIGAVAAKIRNDPDSEWGLVSTATKCLKEIGVLPVPVLSRRVWLYGSAGHRFKRRTQSAAIAFLCTCLLTGVVGFLLRPNYLRGQSRHGEMQDVSESDRLRALQKTRSDIRILAISELLFFGVIGVFLYFAVRRVSKGAENISALKWALSAPVFYISIPLFYFYREGMRRDAAAFDWDGLRDHLEAHSVAY